MGAVVWALNFFTLAYTARTLGSTTFGYLAFGLSVAAYASVLAAPGLNVWGVRATSRYIGEAGKYFVLVNGTQLILGVLAFSIVWLGAMTLLPQVEARIVTASALGVFSLAVGTQWLCQALERYDLIGASQLIAAVLTTVTTIALVRGPEATALVPVLILLGQIAAGGTTLFVLVRRGLLRFVAVSARDAIRALPTSFALGAAPVLIAILHNSNTVILQISKGAAEVGLFTSGYRIVEMLGLVPTLVASLFFPRLARSRSGSPEFIDSMTRFVSLTMAIAFFPALVMLSEGHELARLLYGGDYEAAAPIIRVMSVAVLFNFAAIAYLMGVLAAQEDRAYLVSLGATAAISVGSGFAIVPTSGMLGAAVVVSSLDLITWLLTLPVHRRICGSTFIGEWGRPAVAAVIAALWLVFAAAIAVPFILRITLAGVIYGTLVFVRRTAGSNVSVRA